MENQWYLTIAESSFDTSIIILSDTAPTESLPVQAVPRKPEFESHNFRETHSKSPERVRKTCRQSKPHNTTRVYSLYFENMSLTRIGC